MSVPMAYGSGQPSVGRGDSLADLLERVLDKGVVIAGDVAVNVLDIELLTLKVRLLIASADTAKDMGIDWWTTDPFLSSRAREASQDHRADGRSTDRRLDAVVEENRQLHARLDRLETALASGGQRGIGAAGGPSSG
jgi:hypothetical protein